LIDDNENTQFGIFLMKELESDELDPEALLDYGLLDDAEQVLKYHLEKNLEDT